MKSATILTLLAAVAVSTAQAKWQRLPSIDKKPTPMNFVSAGAVVHSSSGVDQPNALVLGDLMKGVGLRSGNSQATIKFASQTWFDSVVFISDGIEGKVTLSASSDAQEWATIRQQVCTPADRMVSFEPGKVQARYVRLDFELARGGKIRGLQIFGADTSANYEVTQTPGEGAPVNFASGAGGGRLVYIDPELFRGKDEAVKTGIVEFPESDAKYRTAVYDLGQTRILNEFGSVHSARPVRFAVFAFDNLPEKEDWRGRLAFDPTALDTAVPAATAEDAVGTGITKVRPKRAVKARYIALRWEPDFNPPGFTSYGISISGSGTTTFTSNGITVTTTGDGAGGFTATVTDSNGNTVMTITGNANGGITVTGNGTPNTPGGPTGPGTGTGTEAGSFDGGSIPIPPIIGSPSAAGAGLGGLPPAAPPPAPGGSATP